MFTSWLSVKGLTTYNCYEDDNIEPACFITWSEWQGCYIEGRPETAKDVENYQALHDMLIARGWTCEVGTNGDPKWYAPKEAASGPASVLL